MKVAQSASESTLADFEEANREARNTLTRLKGACPWRDVTRLRKRRETGSAMSLAVKGQADDLKKRRRRIK